MRNNITAKFEGRILTLHVDLGEEAGGVIRCLPDGTITLHEIPQYGGEERLSGNHATVNAAIETALGWT